MVKIVRYFSMFSGIGGFELAIESATYGEAQCVGYSEIDKYAITTYKKQFPTHTNYGDATQIEPNKLPDFDLLCAGFPCQAFSIAGKRKGFADTRGTLFFDISRILRIKKPKVVLLENVKGLLNHEKGKTYAIILQTLSELGYDIQWMVLNSKFFGVPQNRERVFLIGNLRGTSRSEVLPFREDGKGFVEGGSGMYVIDYIQGDISGKGYKSQQDRVYNPEGVMCCLPSSNPGNKTKVMIRDMIRRLTPTECERLQGFPDDWTSGVSDTQRYRQLGNAVTVNVVRELMRKIL